MDIKETPFGFETAIIGSDSRRYLACRWHHSEGFRMHLVGMGTQYDGNPTIWPFEKHGDAWIGRGKEYPRMTSEYEAFESLLSAVIKKAASVKWRQDRREFSVLQEFLH